MGAGSNIAAGKGASVKVTTTSGDEDKFHHLAAWRKSIEKAIHDNANLDRDEKEELGEQIEKIEKELIKADINTKKIEKSPRNLRWAFNSFDVHPGRPTRLMASTKNGIVSSQERHLLASSRHFELLNSGLSF